MEQWVLKTWVYQWGAWPNPDFCASLFWRSIALGLRIVSDRFSPKGSQPSLLIEHPFGGWSAVGTLLCWLGFITLPSIVGSLDLVFFELRGGLALALYKTQGLKSSNRHSKPPAEGFLLSTAPADIAASASPREVFENPDALLRVFDLEAVLQKMRDSMRQQYPLVRDIFRRGLGSLDFLLFFVVSPRKIRRRSTFIFTRQYVYCFSREKCWGPLRCSGGWGWLGWLVWVCRGELGWRC